MCTNMKAQSHFPGPSQAKPTKQTFSILHSFIHSKPVVEWASWDALITIGMS